MTEYNDPIVIGPDAWAQISDVQLFDEVARRGYSVVDSAQAAWEREHSGVE